jgi:hypothetical protein
MPNLEHELQESVYTLLANDSQLNALITGVYDEAPQVTTAFPYVTLGDTIHNEFDTDTELGFDCSMTIHTWSRYRGRSETKLIQGAIYTALHRALLSVTGYNLITCEFRDSQSLVDPDGITRHGTQTFRLLLDEA